MTMSKQELAAIVAELDADLKKGEADAQAALKKADEPPKDDSSSPADESASADSSPAPDASAPAPDAAPPAPPADASAGGPPAPGADPAADQALTPEALQAEYSQLSPEELDMHLQAAMAAKEALAAAAQPAMPPAGAPPAGAPPAAPPAPPADASAGGPPPPPMGKTGKDMNINSENTGGKISKAEEELRALVKSQSEDIENLTKAVKIVLETPIRKSVTSIADAGVPFQKTEVKSMGRRDVDNFIKDNAQKMTKAERDLWLDFVDNKVKAEKLAPMLERLSSK